MSADGYEVSGWTVNGKPVTGTLGTNGALLYQLPGLTGPVTAVATFAKSRC